MSDIHEMNRVSAKHCRSSSQSSLQQSNFAPNYLFKINYCPIVVLRLMRKRLSGRGSRRCLYLRCILLIHHRLLFLAHELVHELANLFAEGSETKLLSYHFCAATCMLAGIFVVGNGFGGEGHCD
jgi:hypothetical protein